MAANKTPVVSGGGIPERSGQVSAPYKTVAEHATSQPFNIGDRVRSALDPGIPDMEVLGIGPWHGAPSGWLVCTNGRAVRCVCASTLRGVKHA